MALKDYIYKLLIENLTGNQKVLCSNPSWSRFSLDMCLSLYLNFLYNNVAITFVNNFIYNYIFVFKTCLFKIIFIVCIYIAPASHGLVLECTLTLTLK